ncbi:MFS transporter [Actinomadura madurae]|uniref:MFS transporter n=1 Tax=Actinomadura madurae TaxID=1993 RepID=UPI00355628A3
MTETRHPHTRETSRLGGRGSLILITLCGATFMTGLDFSIVTVALPEIGRDLGFANAGSLQWVATACLLPTASLLPLFGRVADIVGRRRLFTLGVALFSAFSLIAGLATGPAMLIGGRVGQGTAAAMIAPTAIALLTTVFPEGPRRTRALGVNGAVLSLGFVLGTLGGGMITSGLDWRWTMLFLVAVGALVLLGAATVLPGPTRASRPGSTSPAPPSRASACSPWSTASRPAPTPDGHARPRWPPSPWRCCPSPRSSWWSGGTRPRWSRSAC